MEQLRSDPHVIIEFCQGRCIDPLDLAGQIYTLDLSENIDAIHMAGRLDAVDLPWKIDALDSRYAP